MQHYALSDRLSAVWLWCVFLYSGSCLLLGVLPVLKRLDDHAVKTTVERIPFEERKGYLFTKSYRMVIQPVVAANRVQTCNVGSELHQKLSGKKQKEQN